MEAQLQAPTIKRMTAARSRPALHAFAWTAFFALWHGYWALGGDLGFGDQESAFPDAGLLFTGVVSCLFVAGLAIPLAVARDAGPRRLLRALMWAGAVVLAARGAAGLIDDLLRFSGAAETGITGLTDEQVLGVVDPSAYTIWSTVGIDAFFALGGLLFALAGLRRPVRLPRPTPAWAAYAASAWAIAYAGGVRGYQGFGGTVGAAGTFEDPDAMRRASLLAGLAILIVGVGALAFVRPWGLRLPRRPLIGFALVGSVYSMAHALSAYVTKPLHVAGVIELQFSGWRERDEASQFLWDLLFYEPWFLGLGLLVTVAALHHHRRTGGADPARHRLIVATAVSTLALTVVACVMVIAQA